MPREEIRVAVGSVSTARSTVWKFFLQKNDVYILSRMFGSDVKVSLHADGNCFFSCTSDWVRKSSGRRNSDRHIEKWRMPLPVGLSAVHVYRIRIPETELSTIETSEDLSGVEWLQAPVPGATVSLECYLTPPSASDPTLTASPPNPVLFALRRSDDRWFVVTRYDAQLDGRTLDSYRERARAEMRARGVAPQPHYRAVLATRGVAGEAPGLIELVP